MGSAWRTATSGAVTKGTDARVAVRNRTDGETPGPHTGGASECSPAYRSDYMDTNTLIVIVLIVLLLGGGGLFYSRRGA